MTSFDHFWLLLESHGTLPNKKLECARLWDTYSLDAQREIYSKISFKIRNGKFVNYNPVLALTENATIKPTTLSYRDYYTRFGTTEEMNGWHMVKPAEGNVYYEKKGA